MAVVGIFLSLQVRIILTAGTPRFAMSIFSIFLFTALLFLELF